MAVSDRHRQLAALTLLRFNVAVSYLQSVAPLITNLDRARAGAEPWDGTVAELVESTNVVLSALATASAALQRLNGDFFEQHLAQKDQP